MRASKLLAIFLACESVSAQSELWLVNVRPSYCADDCATPLSTKDDLLKCLGTMTKAWRVGCRDVKITLGWRTEDATFCSETSDVGPGSYHLPLQNFHDLLKSIVGIEHMDFKLDLGFMMSKLDDCPNRKVFAVEQDEDPCTDSRRRVDHLRLEVGRRDSCMTVVGDYNSDEFFDGLLITWEGAQCKVTPYWNPMFEGFNINLQVQFQPPEIPYQSLELTFDKECPFECKCLIDVDSVRGCVEGAAHLPECKTFNYERTFEKVLSKSCGTDKISLGVDLSVPIFPELDLIRNPPAQTTFISDVAFNWKASEGCGKPELWLAQECGKETDLDIKAATMSQASDQLHFTGREPMDWTFNDTVQILKIVFPDQDSDCQITQDEEQQDTVTLLTYFQV